MLWCSDLNEFAAVSSSHPTEATDDLLDRKLIDGEIITTDARDLELSFLFGTDIFENPDSLIREKGMRILDKMLDTDAEIKNPYILKKAMRISGGFTIDPRHPDNPTAEERAAFIKWNFEEFLQTSIRSFLLKIWDATRQGFKIAEIVWRVIPDGPWAGKIGLWDLRVRNSRNYSFATDENGRIKPDGIVEGMSSTGIQISGKAPRRLPRRKFVIYTYASLDDDGASLYGRSDYRVVWRYYYGNLVSHKNELRGIETTTRPPVILQHPTSYQKTQRKAIVKKFSGAYNRVATSLPSDWKWDVLESKRTSDAIPHMMEYNGDQISRGLLMGPFLQGAKKQGVSMGRQQLLTFIFMLDALGEETSDDIMGRQIIEPLIRMNFDGPLMAPIFKMPKMSKDRVTLGAFIKDLAESGVIDPGEAWIREFVDVPPQSSSDADRIRGNESADANPDNIPQSYSANRGDHVFVRGGEIVGVTFQKIDPIDKPIAHFLFAEEDNGQSHVLVSRPVSMERAKLLAKSITGSRRDIKVRIGTMVGRVMGFPAFRIDEIITSQFDGPVSFSENDSPQCRVDFIRVNRKTRLIEDSARVAVIRGFKKSFKSVNEFIAKRSLKSALNDLSQRSQDISFLSRQLSAISTALFTQGGIDFMSEAKATPSGGSGDPSLTLDTLGLTGKDLAPFDTSRSDMESLPIDAFAWKQFSEIAIDTTGFVFDEEESRITLAIVGLLREAVSSKITKDDFLKQFDDRFAKWASEDVGSRVDLVMRNIGNQFYNMGRLKTGRALPSVRAFQYSSLMDERGTKFCETFGDFVADKNARVWDGLIPPNHFGCRSIILPVLNSDSMKDSTPIPRLQPSPGFGRIRT